MRTYAVVNHKGGAGKTTTAVHLAWGLADRGYRTVLVDLDPQGAVAGYFRLAPRYTLYHTVWEGVDPNGALVPVREGLQALLADGTLAQLELGLADRPRRESALRDVLGQVSEQDAVVLDCPPSLSLIIVNAFYAAHGLVAPVQMELLSMRGLVQTLEYAQLMGRYLQYQPDVHTIVPTMVRPQERRQVGWLRRLQRNLPASLLAAPVPYDTAIPESLHAGRTVFEEGRPAPAAERYWRLVDRMEADLAPAPESEIQEVVP